MVDLFEKAEDMQLEGRQLIELVEVEGNHNFIWLPEGGPIPTAGKPDQQTMRITPKYGYGTISLTNQEIVMSKSNKGAFARSMRLKMDSLVKGIAKNRNRLLCGDGRGILALVNGDPTTGTTITVDTPGNFGTTTNGSRFIHPRMWVAFIDPVSGLPRSGGSRQVVSVPTAGTTFTISAACDTDVADNDYIVMAYGSDTSLTADETSYNNEPDGIMSFVDDGTYKNGYFGLSRTQFPVMKSTCTASVGALSVDILQRHVDVVTQLSGKSVDAHLMHPSVRRAYLAISEADRRYTLGKLVNPDAGTNAAKGGYDNTVDFGGVPLKIDWAFPYGTWIGYSKDMSFRYPVVDGEWVQNDGSILSRSTTYVDTFDAQYRVYEAFSHLKPNSCFRLTGITASVVSLRIA